MTQTITHPTSSVQGTAEAERRRYPRRRLRGEVTVWYSERLPYPKYHFVRTCEGLERTPDEAVGERVFPDVFDLALDRDGRPCRMCALESVLVTALDRRKWIGAADVFVTSTSQANPRNPDSALARFEWGQWSDSGAARLRRLARRAGLTVTATVAGPVLWGWTDARTAACLAANLRSCVRTGVEPGSLDDAVIEIAWALINDCPPELAELRGETSAIDAWDTARRLLG